MNNRIFSCTSILAILCLAAPMAIFGNVQNSAIEGKGSKSFSKKKNKDKKQKDPKKIRKNKLKKEGYTHPQSKLAHTLLDNLRGLEIGATDANPFGLNTLNVDIANEGELFGIGENVDLVAFPDKLPFKDNTVDFVINANVIDRIYDPINAIQEWLRVVKPGGYVFMIIPNKDRMSSAKNFSRTTIAEINDRHNHPNPPANYTVKHHYSYWLTEDFVELAKYYKWNIVQVQDKDDKTGKGFIIVLQKT